jgi:hypothetical protein
MPVTVAGVMEKNPKDNQSSEGEYSAYADCILV